MPAIIEWPRSHLTPRVTQVPANTVDIYPTLLDLLGIEPDRAAGAGRGRLVSVIDGKSDTRPKPMGFWDYKEGGISTRATNGCARSSRPASRGGLP